jgi:hypothetical protein
MRYLSMYIPDAARPATPPSKDYMAKMGEFMAESFKSGVLVATGGLLPISQGGVRVRSAGGDIAVMDGPFTEAKEVVAGWAILEVKSREEVIAVTRQFIQLAGDGECELRQIMEQGDVTCG